MPLTLSDIRQFIQDHASQDSSSKGLRIADKIANSALHTLHTLGVWDFNRGLIRLAYAAAKSDGVVSVAAGGTVVTGVGTAFAAADNGKYLRFNGESLQYRITAAPALATACTAEAYKGSIALSAVNYALTQDRVALPNRFRMALREEHSNEIGGLEEITLTQLLWMRMHERATGTPLYCAFDGGADPDATTGGSPTKYLWVYPSPAEAFILQIPAVLRPNVMSQTTDGISAPEEAEASYLELIRALIYRENGDFEKFTSQYQLARSAILNDLSAFRARSTFNQREMWDSSVDEDLAETKVIRAKNGETF